MGERWSTGATKKWFNPHIVGCCWCLFRFQLWLHEEQIGLQNVNCVWSCSELQAAGRSSAVRLVRFVLCSRGSGFEVTRAGSCVLELQARVLSILLHGAAVIVPLKERS